MLVRCSSLNSGDTLMEVSRRLKKKTHRNKTMRRMPTLTDPSSSRRSMRRVRLSPVCFSLIARHFRLIMKADRDSRASCDKGLAVTAVVPVEVSLTARCHTFETLTLFLSLSGVAVSPIGPSSSPSGERPRAAAPSRGGPLASRLAAARRGEAAPAAGEPERSLYNKVGSSPLSKRLLTKKTFAFKTFGQRLLTKKTFAFKTFATKKEKFADPAYRESEDSDSSKVVLKS